MPQFDFSCIDYVRLSAIANWLISVETVQDAQELCAKIEEAAHIVTEAALRILGYESRTLMDSAQSDTVDLAVAQYRAETLD